PLAIADTDVTVTTPGLAGPESATIVLTNAKAGDSLSIAGALPSGIDSTIDTSVPGQITLHLLNPASAADYQTGLDQIRFVNTSDHPDPTDRDITVQVSGNEVDSNVAHATVHVVPRADGAFDFNFDNNGNGHADILLQNSASGGVSIWESGVPAGASTVATAVPASWHLAGVGDFDGNGASDILWQNDNG